MTVVALSPVRQRAVTSMYTCVYMDLKPSERPIASVLRMPIGGWRLSAGMYPVARSRSSALFWAVIALCYGWGLGRLRRCREGCALSLQPLEPPAYRSRR